MKSRVSQCDRHDYQQPRGEKRRTHDALLPALASRFCVRRPIACNYTHAHPGGDACACQRMAKRIGEYAKGDEGALSSYMHVRAPHTVPHASVRRSRRLNLRIVIDYATALSLSLSLECLHAWAPPAKRLQAKRLALRAVRLGVGAQQPTAARIGLWVARQAARQATRPMRPFLIARAAIPLPARASHRAVPYSQTHAATNPL
mmetsp:Transcript_11261/g.28812  ORF Transcript_11261/g.28812 Transcript_11261/m.28812 type:complete len:203 (-) Transcript_11261:1061-1669(-)